MSEGFLDKFLRKAGRDPLVPVGCGATLACLLAGLYTFHTGQAALSQKMMRARVVAQGATIVVLETFRHRKLDGALCRGVVLLGIAKARLQGLAQAGVAKPLRGAVVLRAGSMRHGERHRQGL